MTVNLKVIGAIVSQGISHQFRKEVVTFVTRRTFSTNSPITVSFQFQYSNHQQLRSLRRFYSLKSTGSALKESKNTNVVKMPEPQGLPVDFEDTIDPIQRALLAEECIRLDYNDNVIGHDTKKNCHLVRPDGDIWLHRAFSVFLFNTKGELLLQQRSKVKVTFPSMYTNTCCSHPLFRDDEMTEKEALGVKIAAQRRLYEELGIPKEDVPLEAFQYLTRIHYKAVSNSIWGEHEIDYIFIVQRDVTIRPNPNEIDDVRYVTLDQLIELKNRKGIYLTPWFKLILESGKLPLWWKNLNNLKQFQDHQTIHRM